MILRLFSVGRLAALLLFGLGVAPAAAGGGCVYGSGCFAPGPVIQPYYYQSCSCCGCGSSYYASFYPAYAYPAVAVGAGCCGYGYGYGVGYGVAVPPVYRPRVAYPRYIGPRRYFGPRVVRARY
jgi:hypothetical protein